MTGAISRCPFLHAIKDYHGEDSAERLATNPFVSNAFDAKTLKPILPEDPAGSIAAVFKLFHGKQGPIPLTEAAKRDEPRKKVACPRRSAPTEITINDDELPHQVMMMDGFPAHHPMMASISLSGFGFPLVRSNNFVVLQNFGCRVRTVKESRYCFSIAHTYTTTDNTTDCKPQQCSFVAVYPGKCFFYSPTPIFSFFCLFSFLSNPNNNVHSSLLPGKLCFYSLTPLFFSLFLSLNAAQPWRISSQLHQPPKAQDQEETSEEEINQTCSLHQYHQYHNPELNQKHHSYSYS